MAANKYLIIIAGPTAIGKTELSIDIAKHYNTEIISSDSRQYYKEISIGTAKPSATEQSEVIHHFIDSLSIHDDYSIGQFERDVIAKLSDRFKEKDIMIVTGGSGMHIRAITHGLDDFPTVPADIKEKWESIFRSEGIQALHHAIYSKDPVYAKVVDLNNSRRLIRALCVTDSGDQPFSAYLHRPTKTRGFKTIPILLERDREELYNRINLRVDRMIESGLEKEARSVYPFKNLRAMNTIGYKELFTFFGGSIDLSTAIGLIKRNTRRYAKRQMTWFRKEKYWTRINASDKDNILSYIASQVD